MLSRRLLQIKYEPKTITRRREELPSQTDRGASKRDSEFVSKERTDLENSTIDRS